MTQVKSFLAHYIQYVEQGDLKKLKAVALAGESLARNPTPTPTPSIETFTTRRVDRPEDFAPFNPETARCTIPMAMTLLSSIEVIGSLLQRVYHEDFRNSAELFFDYAGNSISEKESGVLNAIFRNGLMHSFFPKLTVGITYDTSYQSREELFITQGNLTILNVNYVHNTFIKGIYKLYEDTAKHVQMESVLQALLDKDANRVQRFLDEYIEAKDAENGSGTVPI